MKFRKWYGPAIACKWVGHLYGRAKAGIKTCKRCKTTITVPVRKRRATEA